AYSQAPRFPIYAGRLHHYGRRSGLFKPYSTGFHPDSIPRALILDTKQVEVNQALAVKDKPGNVLSFADMPEPLPKRVVKGLERLELMALKRVGDADPRNR